MKKETRQFPSNQLPTGFRFCECGLMEQDLKFGGDGEEQAAEGHPRAGTISNQVP